LKEEHKLQVPEKQVIVNILEWRNGW